MRSSRFPRVLPLLTVTLALLAACGGGGRGAQTGLPGGQRGASPTPTVSASPSGTPLTGTVRFQCVNGFTPVELSPAGDWQCRADVARPTPAPGTVVQLLPIAGAIPAKLPPAPGSPPALDVVPLPPGPLQCPAGWQPLRFPRYGYGLCVPPGSVARLEPGSSASEQEPGGTLIFLAAPGEQVAVTDPRHRQVSIGLVPVALGVIYCGPAPERTAEVAPVSLVGGRTVTGCIDGPQGVTAPEARRGGVVFSTATKYVILANFDLSDRALPPDVPVPHRDMRPLGSAVPAAAVVATLRSLPGGR